MKPPRKVLDQLAKNVNRARELAHQNPVEAIKLTKETLREAERLEDKNPWSFVTPC